MVYCRGGFSHWGLHFWRSPEWDGSAPQKPRMEPRSRLENNPFVVRWGLFPKLFTSFRSSFGPQSFWSPALAVTSSIGWVFPNPAAVTGLTHRLRDLRMTRVMQQNMKVTWLRNTVLRHLVVIWQEMHLNTGGQLMLAASKLLLQLRLTLVLS